METKELYSISWQWTGDDGEDYLNFAYLTAAEALTLQARLDRLEREDDIQRGYVSHIQTNMTELADVLETVKEREALLNLT